MRRQTSLLGLGIFAACAGAQVAACSSDDSAAPGVDAGSDSALPNQDSGPGTGPAGCSGPLPVMTVRNPDGGAQMLADWSCYAPGANSYFRPLDVDAGDDAATDAGSDAASDAGQDSSTPVDAGTDSAVPTDASPPDANVPTPYSIHIIDFSSGQPPVGATVDLFWGESTQATTAFEGIVDDAGILAFPQPPAGTAYLSFHLLGSSTQEPMYWQGQPIVPPGVNAPFLGNGQTEGNSVSVQTRDTLLTSVFGSQAPREDLAVLVSAAIDCSGTDVQGAQFTLIDQATGLAVATGSNAGDPRAFYFINDIPNSRCTYTNNIAKGVWSMGNAPVNEPGSTHPYILRMSGRMTESDPPEGVPIHDKAVELYSGGISLALTRKLRGPPPNVPASPDGG